MSRGGLRRDPLGQTSNLINRKEPKHQSFSLRNFGYDVKRRPNPSDLTEKLHQLITGQVLSKANSLERSGRTVDYGKLGDLYSKQAHREVDLGHLVKESGSLGEALERVNGEFNSHLRTSFEKEVRQKLKVMLTTLRFDPPEDVIEGIEELLMAERKDRNIVSWKDISCGNLDPKWKVSVWRGDITTLEIDAIVNAANKVMLGCFTPNHPCIDNVIHAYAGPGLRKECRAIMQAQGSLEATGQAKITKAYCLPSKYVIHTVGPIVKNPEDENPGLLASCYRECLELAKANKARSIALCCISTGIFGYPAVPAAKVALSTTKEWLQKGNLDSMDRIVFNVYTQKDLDIYQDLAPKFFS